MPRISPRPDLKKRIFQRQQLEETAGRYEREIRGLEAREGLGRFFDRLEERLELELAHVYVFSRTLPSKTVAGAQEFLGFYQLPHSEISPKRLRLKLAAEFVHKTTAGINSWDEPLQASENAKRCNDLLAEEPFLLPFGRFQVFFQLFNPDSVDSTECLKRKALIPVNEQMQRFLESPLGSYPKKLKALERILFHRRTIISATNLFHASAWIATLLVIGNQADLPEAPLLNGLDSALFRLRPLIAEKMYHLVHEGRFLRQPLAHEVSWAMGELHRLACGLGCTRPRMDPSSRILTLSATSKPLDQLPTRRSLRMEGQEWSIVVQPPSSKNVFGFFDTGIERIGSTLSLVEEMRRALLDNARAAIMSRNMSHNIGSHALAGITQDEFVERPRDVEVLLRYLQERMDFVARVSTEWPSWRQPQLFLRDLVDGWTRQGLLLDKIIRDDGYCGQCLELHIILPGGGESLEFEYGDDPDDLPPDGTAKKTRLRLKKGDASATNDVLVAVPGGVVGRQAFYGFLENAMRNAAKHNLRAKTLVVCLEIVATQKQGQHPAYQIKYRDSLSLASRLCTEIQEKLGKELIEASSGKIVSRDWGIQEMKVYADYLAHPFTEGNGVISVHEDAKSGQRLRLWAEGGINPSGHDEKVLEYRFLLLKPTLALVCGAEKPALSKTSSRVGLRFEELNLEDPDSAIQKLLELVTETCPALLYLKCQRQSIRSLLTVIKENELALPARILIKVEEEQDSLASDLHYSKLLENRRLIRRVYFDEESGDFPQEPARSDGSSFEKYLRKPEVKLAELYRRWLLAFVKQRPDVSFPLNIALYFDRGGDAGKGYGKSWRKLGQHPLFESFSELICVFPLYQCDADEQNFPKEEMAPWTPACLHRNLDVSGIKGSWLFFDNHRKAWSQLRGKIRDEFRSFYHYFGSYSAGKSGMPNNRDMFDLLSNPPAGMPGVFFLNTLVEAALLDVLVLDERVAGSFFELAESDEETLLVYRTGVGSAWNSELRFARIHVAAGWHIQDSVQPFIPTIASKVNGAKPPALYSSHSLVISGKKVVGVLDVGEKPRQLWNYTSDHYPLYDVAVVHRGVLEDLIKRVDIAFSKPEEVASALQSVAGRVIVTSGRGAQIEDPLGNFPFVEFSTIQAYVKAEISKVSLSNVAMSAVGKGARHG